jgi:hypothetical protein
MEHPMNNRFVPAVMNFVPSLMINDWAWWEENEREIYNWMGERLPRGIEHQQGIVLSFDDEQQRMMFLLRWA